MQDRVAAAHRKCADCGFLTLVERRQASVQERQDWVLRQVKPYIRMTSTALLSMSGATLGLLGAMTATGALAPLVAAQSPITIAPGGMEKILWSVIAAGAGLLVYMLKAWVDRMSGMGAAHEIAIATLRERLATLEGESKARQND